MASLHARLSAVAPHLLLIPASRQIPDPHRRPAQVGHHFRQSSKRARSAIALWHFKQDRTTSDD